MKVAVVGARGRMGREVVRAVEAADDLELGACLDVGDDVDAVAGADAHPRDRTGAHPVGLQPRLGGDEAGEEHPR